jgi:hypothetical protein
MGVGVPNLIDMKFVRYFAAALIVSSLIYALAYLVSVQKIDAAWGSSPIYGRPDWLIKMDSDTRYRFLDHSSFWNLAHGIDLRIRPEYWTYIVRQDSVTWHLEHVIWQPVFHDNRKRPFLIFPTL